MKKLNKILLSTLLMIVVASVSAGVYYYTLTKPSSVTITLNTWMIELYAESPNPTNIVTSIDFGSVMQGAIVQTPAMYLYGTQNEGGSAKDYILKWNAENLPTGSSIVAKYSWPYGSPLTVWEENTEIAVSGLLDITDTGLSSFQLRFDFDADLAEGGTYSDLQINILAGDPLA